MLVRCASEALFSFGRTTVFVPQLTYQQLYGTILKGHGVLWEVTCIWTQHNQFIIRLFSLLCYWHCKNQSYKVISHKGNLGTLHSIITVSSWFHFNYVSTHCFPPSYLFMITHLGLAFNLYANHTQLYLSIKPDKTNQLFEYQPSLKDIKTWLYFSTWQRLLYFGLKTSEICYHT